MEISVHDYNLLKDKKYNLIQNIKYSDAKSEKIAEYKSQLNKVEEDIIKAEKQDNIAHYLDLCKRRIRLQQTIGSWKYYKKDTSKLEESLKVVQQEIEMLESVTYHHVSPVVTEPPQSQQSVNPILEKLGEKLGEILGKLDAPQLTQTSEPTYYIINLAWSKGQGNEIINTVRDFLNMSNYIESYSEMSDERDEHVISWKYTYDSLEERATVKAIRMCAGHLLDTLKNWKPGVTDAEIFHKLQKY
jgi:protein subunit release factor A